MQSPPKSQLDFFFFSEMEKLILKLILNCKEHQTAKTILKKKNNVGQLTLPHFETYYKATVDQSCAILGRKKT